MATTIRASVSMRNPYYITKHRYYELKHFCLQYNEWKRKYDDLCSIAQSFPVDISSNKNHFKEDWKVFERQYYLDKMSMVEESLSMVGDEYYDYLLKAVTEGISYSHLKTKMRIPFCKETYYEAYRKFFWILANRKDFA